MGRLRNDIAEVQMESIHGGLLVVIGMVQIAQPSPTIMIVPTCQRRRMALRLLKVVRVQCGQMAIPPNGIAMEIVGASHGIRRVANGRRAHAMQKRQLKTLMIVLLCQTHLMVSHLLEAALVQSGQLGVLLEGIALEILGRCHGIPNVANGNEAHAKQRQQQMTMLVIARHFPSQ
jgi:hypothetical protein